MSSQPSTKQIVFGEELTFEEKRHHYKWGGKLVPGVTTILNVISKPALQPWAAKMASEAWVRAIKMRNGESWSPEEIEEMHVAAKGSHLQKSEDAAEIGNNVHDYAECFFKKRDLPILLTDQAKRGVEAFHKWFDAHNVKIKASERRLFSKEFYYAGTCDFVAEIDGVLGVGDIKTSAGMYREYRFQTAAYQHALQEEKNIQFPVRWIVRFDKKTGDFEAKSFYDFDLDFKGFKAALELHKTFKEIEKEGAR